MKKIFKKLAFNIPLLLVILVSIFIALQNTSIRGYYSGWDNIHAELDLGQYAYRSLYGAWSEHEGLGGPAAKGLLAEITRIPYLFILMQVFPLHLVRAVFLFTMYVVGGVTMYFFIKSYWIQNKTQYKTWIAGFAGLLYLLHPLTLQQFYISFELFTVQFAFFPLLLISLHELVKKISPKSVLLFCTVQILLAASAHTPTVFYLGAVASVLYALAIHLQIHSKLRKAISFSLMIGLASFVINGFWIVPNLYYSLHNSEYVTESKANVVFGPEALWSIREASTVHSYLTGYHYLTSWKDYNFETKEHELIFNEWVNHFANPFRNLQLYILAGLSLCGAIIGLLSNKKYPIKAVMSVLFLLTSAFIWIELFPTKDLLLKFYESKTFLEIFRNPFTKLSILHSIFVVILASEAVSKMVEVLEKKVSQQLLQTIVPIFISLGFIYTLSITAPSFSGNFINEKLYVIFPEEYQELYSFLQTQDHSNRVLEMPYTSREGWVIYDWSTKNRIYGYQGIGFYFFGIPQPFLTSDFARWSGVNDYLYEELSFAINSQNPQQLEHIAHKYIIPLAILDESRVQPYRQHSFELDKEMLKAAGYKQIWQKNFLTVYEHETIIQKSDPFIIPETIAKISADTKRLSIDPVIEEYPEHIVIEKSESSVDFPFSWLQKTEAKTQTVTESELSLTTNVNPGKYTIQIPAFATQSYKTTIALKIQDSQLEVFFPQYTLNTGSEIVQMATIDTQVIQLEKRPLALQINGRQIALSNTSEYTYAEINIPVGDTLIIQDVQTEKILAEILPNWQLLTKEQIFESEIGSELIIKTSFPNIRANLELQPSENCVRPQQGSIETTYSQSGATTYTANNYGVNCNTIHLPFMSPVNEYIAVASGENISGRSIKLFVHYSKPNTVPTEYIFPDDKYTVSYPLKQLSSDPDHRLFLNWETRSFGQKSENRLDSLTIVPFHISNFSKVKLLSENNADVSVENTVSISNQKKHSITRYSLDATCESICYVGINQAYDDLWIAYDFSTNKIFPHYRYNNWANLWEIQSGTHSIMILYIPQYIAFAFLGVTTLTFVVIGIKLVTQKPKQKSKRTHISKSVRKSVQGKSTSK